MNTYELNIRRFKIGTPTRRVPQFYIDDNGHIRVSQMGECDEIHKWLTAHGATHLGTSAFVSFWKVSKETQMLFLLKWSSYQ